MAQTQINSRKQLAEETVSNFNKVQDLLAKAKKEKQISGREQQKNMAAQKQREEAEALAE